MLHSPKINSIIQNKVKYKLTNFIYPNLLTTLPLLLFVGFILFYKFYGHDGISKVYLILWLVAFLTFIIFQGALGVWFQKTNYSLKWEQQYPKLLNFHAGLIGILWGIAGIVFMPEDSVGQSFLMLILAFVAAGGLVYLTGTYLAGALYATGVLVPLAGLYFSLYLQNHYAVYFNATLGILYYWAFLLAVNHYGNKLYADNFKQRIINKNLTENLTYATEELEKSSLISYEEKERYLLSQNQKTVASKTLSEYADPLTGVDSQELLEIKFIQACTYARRHHQSLAVYLVDVTNLQDVTASLDKDVANLLLKAIALRLQYCIRETDGISRTNDNKFILIISEVLLEHDLSIVTNRILKMLADDIKINGNIIQINTNIGISLFPQDGNDLQELIKKCEIALSARDKLSQEAQFQIYDDKK